MLYVIDGFWFIKRVSLPIPQISLELISDLKVREISTPVFENFWKVNESYIEIDFA